MGRGVLVALVFVFALTVTTVHAGQQKTKSDARSHGQSAAQSALLLRIEFASGAMAIPTAVLGEIAAIASRQKASGRRIQLTAHTAQENVSGNDARKLSLQRAFAVRARLLQKGMKDSKIDLLALGAPKDGGPKDRVDIVLLGM